MSRGESPAAVILLSLHDLRRRRRRHRGAAHVPAADAEGFSRAAPRMLGGRTRAALEREKTLVLRSIKELEFDRAMGKVSEKDFAEMSGRLRARAARLMRQLDAATGYRSEIEQEIAKRIGRRHRLRGVAAKRVR